MTFGVGEARVNEYISCGCNRTPMALDWGVNGVIVFASSNSVACYDPKSGSGGRILKTLNGHTDRINGVRWIRRKDLGPEEEIVSVSSDKTAIVWSPQNGEIFSRYVLVGHNDIVTYCDGKQDENGTCIATSSTDSSVRVWSRRGQEGGFVCLQAIDLGRQVCLSLSLFWIQESLLLATGNDDCRIQISDANTGGGPLLKLEGHEDWVRSIDVREEENGDVFLASGSQDSTVRMWRFSREATEEECLIIKPRKQSVEISGRKWDVSSETVLHGHSDSVMGVQWSPNKCPALITCSLDRTALVWSPEPESGVWLEELRVGELGGNTLGGFFGVRFGPASDSFIAHSYTGAFQFWQKEESTWTPAVQLGGHFGGVVDLSWGHNGDFLISVGLDQTTRVHAQWNDTWHEMSRPQTHGLDMSSVAVLKDGMFISAAEEKVSRVFIIPQLVQRILETLGGLEIGNCGPTSATIPALGLSNRAVNNELDEVPSSKPPSESYLSEHTLWPEVMKLYGHGYDVFCLASSPSGDVVASSCKATTPEDAAIILWSTQSWDKLQELKGHHLTITQMEFSPDSQFLLSVSRDRTWCLFQRQGDKFFRLANSDNKRGIHTRVIWSCSWSHDSSVYATSSRDGRVVVWGNNGSGYKDLTIPLIVKGSVTAVAFAPRLESGKYLLAIGVETGGIDLYLWAAVEEPWEHCYSIGLPYQHQNTVKRLRFRPIRDTKEKRPLQIASCSLDFSLRIFNLYPEKFFTK